MVMTHFSKVSDIRLNLLSFHVFDFFKKSVALVKKKFDLLQKYFAGKKTKLGRKFLKTAEARTMRMKTFVVLIVAFFATSASCFLIPGAVCQVQRQVFLLNS
jgi:hypothetical protein